MTTRVAATLDEALGALAAEPDATVLAGGTDLMVDVNAGRRRLSAVVMIGRVAQLRGWRVDGAMLRIGGATTYTDMLDPAFASVAPGLAEAARTVGSPQIRNAGTLGGNIGTASPAGDTLPVLAALDAVVVLAAAAGERRVPITELIIGPKRTGIAPGELVAAVEVPAGPGRQEYLKVGTRNAMVIAVASCALVIDPPRRRVGVGLGSVGPVPLRAPAAEAWAAERLDWDRPSVDAALAAEFGRLVAAEARPIDDHRSTAEYRRHAVGVLAGRALRRAAAA